MWYCYIIECANGTLYTGITTDLERRFAQHSSGLGARYTRAFGAAKIVFVQGFRTQSRALKREAAIKKYSRAEKWVLINASPMRPKKKVKLCHCQ